jgi:hypothetical protein
VDGGVYSVVTVIVPTAFAHTEVKLQSKTRVRRSQAVLRKIHPLSSPFPHGWTVPAGQGVVIIAAARTYSDTSHLVGLLWTSDQPVAGTST